MRGQGRVYQRTYRDRRTGARRTTETWTLEYWIHGARQRESAATYSEAMRLLKRRQGELAQGRRPDPAGERLTFAQLATMLTNDYRANRRRSLERVEDAVTHLTAAFDGYRAHDITSDRVTHYIVTRQAEGAANATINREQAALKRMFRLAAERLGGYCPAIRMLAENNVRTGFFERAQFEAVRAALPEDLRPVLTVAHITGWRPRSELLTRQRHHVDLEAGWLRLEPGETKNGRGRMFPLVPELRAAIAGQLATTRALEKRTGQVVPWLFHREGRPIRSWRRAWLTACERAGLVRVVQRTEGEVTKVTKYPLRVPHDFRRTAVRNLERAGVPRSTAMQMVGHETESIYRRYAIVDEAMLREGGDKLATFGERRPAAAVAVLPAARGVARRRADPAVDRPSNRASRR